MRKVTLATGKTYHIYNRGIEKRRIFLDPSYYSRFITVLKHCLKYDYPYSLLKRRLENAHSRQGKKAILAQLETRKIKPPVDLFSLCLMPNHKHLTVKQLVKNGITNLMHRLGTSYTKYFNKREKRTGRLFEGTFKVVPVETDEQLIHLTRYQHINPTKLGPKTKEELITYPWSSLSTYLGDDRFDFINPNPVINLFKAPEEYLEFVMAKVDEFEPLRLHEIAIDDDFGWFKKFRELKEERKQHLEERFFEKTEML